MATTLPAREPRLETTAVPNRLILIGGGKGGVGKSTFSRALVDYYEARGASTAAYDGDLENPTLSRFVDSARPLASQSAKGFEALIEAMEKGGAGCLVADLGAGTQRHVAEFERLLGLANAARNFRYQPVLVWMLAPSKDSIALLGQAIEAHSGWNFVVARAVCVVGDWGLWETSNTKKKVDALAPEAIDFPVLDADAYTAIDKRDLRFRDASVEKLGYTKAAYAGRWFGAVCKLLDASPALRAPNKVAS